MLPEPNSELPTGNVTSPAVMLSPNARNFVFESVASFATVTVKEQLAVRFRESVAVHDTFVLPIGKLSPELGEHDTLTVLRSPAAHGAVKSFARDASGGIAMTQYQRVKHWRASCVPISSFEEMAKALEL